MPIYDFACHDCGHRFEASCAYKADNPPCPACHAKTARLPGAPALHGAFTRGREAAMRSLSTGTASCPACAAGRPHSHAK